MKGVRGKFPHHLSPYRQQLSAKREALGLWFLLQRKVRTYEWVPSFPNSLWNCWGHWLLSHPFQNTEVIYITEGQGEHSSQGSKFNGGHKPTNHFADSIRKPARESLGTPPVDPPKLAHGYLQHSAFHTHALTHLMCAPGGSMCNLRGQLFSMGRRLAQPSRIGRKHTHWAALNYPRKANRRLSIQPDFMESGEAYSLKNSPLTGNKKCGAGISIETFWESLRIPLKSDRRHFIPEGCQ